MIFECRPYTIIRLEIALYSKLLHFDIALIKDFVNMTFLLCYSNKTYMQKLDHYNTDCEWEGNDCITLYKFLSQSSTSTKRFGTMAKYRKYSLERSYF